MSVDANALERETLERKDRDELAKIAGALGGKVTSRTRKADIIDLILELTGVTTAVAAATEDTTSKDAAPSESKDTSGDRKDASRDHKQASSDTTGDNGSTPNDAAQSRGARTDAAQSRGARTDAAQSRAARTGAARNEPKLSDDDDESNDDTDTDADTDAKGNGNGNGGGDDSGDANGDGTDAGGQRRRRRGRNRGGNQPEEFTGEPIPVEGCLDLRDDGYGFLRVETMLPSKDDCYVSVKQVRQFDLRKGDIIAGGSRPAFRNEKNPAIVRIDTVNGVELEPGTERPRFEEQAATFATEPLILANDDLDGADQVTARTIDILAPIGKGSRVLLAAPPRTGKTSMLQSIARSVEVGQPDLELIVVLLDERPEEITEMYRLVAGGTVHGSAFDASPDEHVAILDLALARAQRIAESGDDVVVLVDGLTRLARADHATGHTSGRSVGGLDTSAIHTAKRTFGAGRNLEGAGSVTIVATAIIDTGSSIDEAVYEAVAGAATTEITLSREAAERRSFPAVDIGRTGTRREELIVDDDGAASRDALRRTLVGLPTAESADHADGLDHLLGKLRETKSNDEILGA